jgi:hypothetical protein
LTSNFLSDRVLKHERGYFMEKTLKEFLNGIEYPNKNELLSSLSIEDISAKKFSEAFNLPYNSIIIFGFILNKENIENIQEFVYNLDNYEKYHK